ncbi:MAG: 2-oxoacid:ferredoxin oxidoreductase subunit gamma [Candidatus Aerophobetes bacterium]|nr:2-oxoacid:ferredoxin oxidoreductase subunit gamma [Candidatus Aerophobetes bacterium]
MKKEIRIAGFGGQGVVLSGVILGRAAVLYDKKKATQTQSYGAEARGGAARSEVVISDEDIDYPKVINPDILIAISQRALDKYIKDLKPEGILIVDSELVKDLPESCAFSLYRVPASQLASKEFERIIVANMIMLGFLVGLTEVISLEALKSSVRESVPKGTEELNLKALEKGGEIAKEMKRP